MNKKILYSVIFTSIFVLSAISAVTPVTYGYTFGVPDAAKGMELESEIKAYDKELWGECLGGCAEDTCNYMFGGEGSAANDVGAKAKTEIQDWEKEEIWFFGDHLMTSDVAPACDGEVTVFGGKALTDYWSAAEVVEQLLRETGTLAYDRTNPLYWQSAGDCGKVGTLETLVKLGITMDYSTGKPNPFVFGTRLAGGDPLVLGDNASIANAVQEATNLFYVSTPNRQEISEIYAAKYDGVNVEADTWDFVKDGDYDSDPDEEDKVLPFIEDPHDIYDSYAYFNGFLESEFAIVNKLIQALIDVNTTIHASAARIGSENQYLGISGVMTSAIKNMIWEKYSYLSTPYQVIASNTTWAVLGNQTKFNTPYTAPKDEWVPNLLDVDGNEISNSSSDGHNFLADPVDTFIDALLKADGTHPLQGGTPGLLTVVPFFKDKAPLDTKSYLAMVLKSGIPAHQDVERWLSKVIEDFDVEDDVVYGDDFVYGKGDFTNYTGYGQYDVEKINLPDYMCVPVTDNRHQGGISVDGLVVTVEYEWVPGVTHNGVDQREDYEIIYTYSDTGGQSSVEFVSGDDTFWKKESLSAAIPGYEIPILLGVAAISALSLVFIVMKKKRM